MRLPAVSALLLVLLSSTHAHADGKVFVRGVAAPPPIPDQQAIIAWDEGTHTETLAIETRFAPSPPTANSGGTGSSAPAYAWVVPLPGPSAPAIEAATTGLFPTVRAVFQPHVDDRPAPASLPFTIPLCVLLALYVWLRSRSNGVIASALAVGLLTVCLCVMLLPSLGKARGLPSGAGLAGVLDRSIVGSYETAVVGAADGASAPDAAKAIAEWLDGNGFALPASCRPVLADYAARKWVFAAVKLRPDAAAPGAMLTPHPLVFRFKSSSAVYPMALTGVGNAPLTLDLYVFGDRTAGVAGTSVVRCDACRGSFSEYPALSLPQSEITIAHPGLRSIVGPLRVGTKLSGTLAPAQQARDLDITWTAFAPSGAHAFSPRGAANRAIEVGVGAVPIGMIGLYVLAGLRSAGPKWALRRLHWTLPAGLIAGLAVYAATPVVEVVPGGARRAYADRSMLIRSLPTQLLMVCGSGASMPTDDAVRRVAADFARNSGAVLRFEDAPGGVTFQRSEAPDVLWYVMYDAAGAPFCTEIWGQAGEKGPRPGKPLFR